MLKAIFLDGVVLFLLGASVTGAIIFARNAIRTAKENEELKKKLKENNKD